MWESFSFCSGPNLDRVEINEDVLKLSEEEETGGHALPSGDGV